MGIAIENRKNRCDSGALSLLVHIIHTVYAMDYISQINSTKIIRFM